MNIYLLRHGIARNRAGYRGEDSSRPLTRAGRVKLDRIARAMQRMGVEPEVVLTSPFKRALETAAIVSARLKISAGQLQTTPALEPGAGVPRLLKELRQLKPAPTAVLLVGHEPDLSCLASLLISGSSKPLLSFKKAGLAMLDCPVLKNGRCGTLCWLLTPSHMALVR